MSRVGSKFGKLTVIEELPTAYRCRCDCGRITLANKSISKPSYRKRLQCEVCAGRPCEVCGKWINATAGMQAATCSVECRKKRASARERERYMRVKDTPEWIASRAAYLERLKRQRRADPEFDAKWRAYRLAVLRRYRDKLQGTEEGRQKAEALRLKHYRKWITKVMSDPALHAARLRSMNRWYHSLTLEERDRIFYQPRRQKKQVEAIRLSYGVEDF